MTEQGNKSGAPGDGSSGGGLVALESLQENASAFFARLAANHGSRMACKAGCSACCHVDLSVFESEAARIVSWVMGLPAGERDELAVALERAKAGAEAKGPGRDAAGNTRVPCVFLVSDVCAVYPARPVICRTQGAPLQWKLKEAKGEKDVTELRVDACPLNFDAGRELPPAAEWLDLDRLGVLQSLAERQYQSARATDAAPEAIAWKKDAQGRVPLRAVRKELLARLRGKCEAGI